MSSINQRSSNILGRMAPGTMGGESRVATFRSYANRSATPLATSVVAAQPSAPSMTFAYVYAVEPSTTTFSANTNSDWGLEIGDYLFNMLFTYGNAIYLGSSEEPEWTGALATLAPTAPRRAYAWDRIATRNGSDDAQYYTWNSPGADVVSLTVAFHEPDLALWAQDWWSGGPSAAFSVSAFEIHRAAVVFVWSDDGSIVDEATLIYRSNPLDMPSIGVIEAWAIQGTGAPATTTSDITVTARSGNIQWASWIDVYYSPVPEPEPPPPDPVAPGSTVVPLGVFRSPSNKTNVDAYSAWQSRSVDYAVAFHGKGATPISNVSSVISAHSGGAYTLVLSLALVPVGGSLSDVASGVHDALFEACADGLIAGGRGDSVIRLGWEGNMNGYDWKAQGQEATYKAAFRRVVTKMQARAGAAFEFSFDVLIGATSANADLMFPGSSYVSWIGLDAYDNSPFSDTGGTYSAPADPAGRWNHLLTRSFGINWWLAKAQANSLKLACWEWGTLVRTDAYANLSGGDNPYYIHKMFALARANEIALAYFEDNESPPAGQHTLMGSTGFPNSRDAYLGEVALL